jgi:hypothetical protein
MTATTTKSVEQALANMSEQATPADMRAFGASDEACYRWPNDTAEHRACRAAFIAGAVAAATPVVLRIAEVARAVGWQANVGGMETAGVIVSSLAERPELIERFLAEGTELMLAGEIAAEKGSLTFHRVSDGKVTTPQELRSAITVKNMERGKPADNERGRR